MWNSGRLPIISASVSPALEAELGEPAGERVDTARSSPQVIVNSSPLVRIATSSGRRAAVMRKASAIVFAPCADADCAMNRLLLPPLPVLPLSFRLIAAAAPAAGGDDPSRS